VFHRLDALLEFVDDAAIRGLVTAIAMVPTGVDLGLCLGLATGSVDLPGDGKELAAVAWTHAKYTGPGIAALLVLCAPLMWGLRRFLNSRLWIFLPIGAVACALILIQRAPEDIEKLALSTLVAAHVVMGLVGTVIWHASRPET
jgi:hypothetical protein